MGLTLSGDSRKGLKPSLRSDSLWVSEESASHQELHSHKKMNSATNCVSRAEGPQASDETPALADALTEASRQRRKPS